MPETFVHHMDRIASDEKHGRVDVAQVVKPGMYLHYARQGRRGLSPDTRRAPTRHGWLRGRRLRVALSRRSFCPSLLGRRRRVDQASFG